MNLTVFVYTITVIPILAPVFLKNLNRIRIRFRKNVTGSGFAPLRIQTHLCYAPERRCAGAGVQESTPAGVGVFQQEQEPDQEWIFSVGTGLGAGVIFNYCALCLFAHYAICDRN